MKASVTDGQLARLAVKQHELFRRAKEGTYENFDDVLTGLQTLIEGKEPSAPTLASEDKFAKWRNFLIGGVNSKALLERVQTGFTVSDWAKDVMK